MIKEIIHTLLHTKSLTYGVLLAVCMFLTPFSLHTAEYASGDYASFTYVHATEGDGGGKNPAGETKLIQQFFGQIILSITSYTVEFGGYLLDTSIDKLILKMTDSVPLSIIEKAWRVIRDVCNLAFIFGFLYVGIRTIFDPDSIQPKRFLVNIIIGALLINFSLFITKAIIDVGNMSAIAVYNSINPNNDDFAILTVKEIGLIKANATELDGDAMSNMFGDNNPLYFFIFMGIFFMVIGFIFTAGAFMIITRFVALVFILIASPILFGATVFPQTEKYASDLWRKLIAYAIFPTVFIFLLGLSLLIAGELVPQIAGRQPLALNEALANVKGTSGHLGDTFLVFVIMTFFLLLTLTISKKLEIVGAQVAIDTGNAMRKKAQGYLGRGSIRTGFHTVRAAKTGVDAFNTRNNADNGGKWQNLKSSWKKNKNISMDGLVGVQENWRESNSMLKNVAAATMRGTGIDEGIQTVHGAKFGSSESIADIDKKNKEVSRVRAQNKQVSDTERDILAVISPQAGLTPEQTAQNRINMERAVATSSSEQILTLHNKLKGKAGHAELVGNLSDNQFDTLMKAKPEELDDNQKTALRQTRQTSVQNRIVENENEKQKAAGNFNPAQPATISDVVGKASASDLGILNFDTVLLPHASQFTTKQIDDMKLTETQKATLKSERKKNLITEMGTEAGLTNIFRRFTKAEDIANLPPEVLTNKLSVEFFTPRNLKKIADSDDMSAHLSTITENIVGAYRGVHGKEQKMEQFEKFFISPAGIDYNYQEQEIERK